MKFHKTLLKFRNFNTPMSKQYRLKEDYLPTFIKLMLLLLLFLINIPFSRNQIISFFNFDQCIQNSDCLVDTLNKFSADSSESSFQFLYGSCINSLSACSKLKSGYLYNTKETFQTNTLDTRIRQEDTDISIMWGFYIPILLSGNNDIELVHMDIKLVESSVH